MTKFKRSLLTIFRNCASQARFYFVNIKPKGGIFMAGLTWSEYATQSSFNDRQLHFLHSHLEEHHPALLNLDCRLTDAEWTALVTRIIKRWQELVAATFEEWA